MVYDWNSSFISLRTLISAFKVVCSSLTYLFLLFVFNVSELTSDFYSFSSHVYWLFTERMNEALKRTQQLWVCGRAFKKKKSIFLPQLWDIIDRWHCVSLRCTMWRFDTFINCKTIITVVLTTTSIHPATFNTLSDIRVHDTVLSAIITMLHARDPNLLIS